MFMENGRQFTSLFGEFIIVGVLNYVIGLIIRILYIIAYSYTNPNPNYFILG